MNAVTPASRCREMSRLFSPTINPNSMIDRSAKLEQRLQSDTSSPQRGMLAFLAFSGLRRALSQPTEPRRLQVNIFARRVRNTSAELSQS
ncbi:hypothetical protein MRB53_038123 [Persea americana]|nr:hypothetical protein MRB53_038123 [Persea americana]